MPSRPFPPPPPSPTNQLKNRHLLLTAVIASATAATAAVLLLLFYLLRRRRRRRHPTLPFSPPPAPARPLRLYSRRALRRATVGFHPSRLLGRGAASPVYLASFPDASHAAVKTSSSPHELHLLASLPSSPHVVSLLGYSSSPNHPLLLVFEYMPHGTLQTALFGNPSDDCFLDWPKRLAVIHNVARALAFLHNECWPPVVHGDLKPSNVLLDAGFRAKIADFGLARFKNPESFPAGAGARDDFLSQELGEAVDLSAALGNNKIEARQKGNADGKDEPGLANAWGKDWWWRQDGSGELDARDYVAEWIGSQICPERNPDWTDDASNSNDPKNSPVGTEDNAASVSPEHRKKTDCNASANGNAGDKEGQMREWWKEEYFDEISKKGSALEKKRGKPWYRSISTSNGNHNDNGNGDGEPSSLDISFRKGWKRSRRRGQSAGSDLHGGGGDLLSRELSSTTSMRGTVCYVAPECGGACEHVDLLEKSDVYSFGVLVLVILSGRRPLHILSSPMKLEKANLVSWCRQLARAGNVLELMDERLDGCYDKEQAALCVHLALLCLQRLPELRPDSADIVKILRGEMELPAAPVEFSQSPRLRRFPRSAHWAASDAAD